MPTGYTVVIVWGYLRDSGIHRISCFANPKVVPCECGHSRLARWNLMNRAKHAWRRAAEAAISPVHFASERERIVVAVADSPIASALDWKSLTAVNEPEHYRMADLYSILADAFRPALLEVSDVAA